MKPHDPAWADAFDSASTLVMEALGSNAISVHHIGSTAIPNIWAKPIIDMMIAAKDIGTVDTCNQAMEKLGYEAMGEFGIPGRRYFRQDDSHGRRIHQIHVFPVNSGQIDRHLAFRDFMRAHSDWANRYSDLKRDLAKKYPHSISDYNTGKESFIKHIDTMAATWRRNAAE